MLPARLGVGHVEVSPPLDRSALLEGASCGKLGSALAGKERNLIAAVDSLIQHCRIVARGLALGSVVPFLGAGANQLGRPPDGCWERDGYLPSGAELAAYLAEPYGFPEEDLDLLRVSQWVDLESPRRLKDELHRVFSKDFRPNKLHRFLAGLPKALRARGEESCGQLILTTNYDHVLEQAFAEAGDPVDVVAFEATRREQRFVHLRPDGERVAIAEPAKYREFALEQRSVILKIHGDVKQVDRDRETFVVTEDHYIDYLARRSIALLPAYLMRRLRESDLCFLGYSMRDWNVRVILREIWEEQATSTGGWSIQRHPSEIDKRFWAKREIKVLDVALEDWVDGMQEQLG